MNLAAFMGEFKAEATDHLEKLDQGLLQLERDPNNHQLVRQLFLSMHTIKGGASMLELKVLKNLTHAFEDVLARLRDQGEACDSNTATLLLRALDMVREIIDTDPSMEQASPQVEDMTSKLRQRANGTIVILEPGTSLVGISIDNATPEPKTVPKSNLALLLEPSETARTVMQRQLEQAGWTVEGFALPETMQPRLAQAGLLVLPLEPSSGIDGLALGKAWRLDGVTIPIVVTALEFSAEQSAQAQSLGLQTLAKPSYKQNHLLEFARGLV
ncbi:MAG: Hpt domain-containing protein [Deinococcales bacterium]